MCPDKRDKVSVLSEEFRLDMPMVGPWSGGCHAKDDSWYHRYRCLLR